MRTLWAFLPDQCMCTKRINPRRRGSGIFFCQIIIRRRISFNSDLRNGCNIGKASTAESVRRTGSTRFLRQRLVSTFIKEAKRQGSSSVRVSFRASQGHWCTIFTGVVLSAFNLSWRMDWFREDMEATKYDSLSSSHHSIFSGENSDEQEPVNDFTIQQKVHYHSSIGNVIRMPCIRVKLNRTQDQDCDSGKRITCNTISSKIITDVSR